ncbi:hypothetical protein PGT21_004835 [Puccinia graminis f. sp. tritici]|uniref:Uncharacterized protein n=1 Tax=Puccinia graminis f. sp. tritici TaxID=56615 RepID=A0A5B0NF71_PUCGR|nr:hypothetical protein PGT21_004835 [Puccinia graminis f. sp. tritici]
MHASALHHIKRLSHCIGQASPEPPSATPPEAMRHGLNIDRTKRLISLTPLKAPNQ